MLHFVAGECTAEVQTWFSLSKGSSPVSYCDDADGQVGLFDSFVLRRMGFRRHHIVRVSSLLHCALG